jgi:hypothetical protein
MPTKRLVLAEPATDGVNDFPYVDVRMWEAIGIRSVNKAVDADGFFIFNYDVILAINFYRVVNSQRVFLAQNYTPQQRLLALPKKIKVVPGAEFDAIVDMFVAIWAAATSQFGLTPAQIQYSVGNENLFEAINEGGRLMVNHLRFLLIKECDQQFAGLAVVEDAA